MYSVNSKFIETPSRKLIKEKFDFRDSAAIATIISDGIVYKGDAAGADVKLEIKVYEDEADHIAQDVFREPFAGAKSVEINIIRVPRENVRSELLLHLESLREKIIERAALAREEVGESVLAKADLLESENQERIFEGLSAA